MAGTERSLEGKEENILKDGACPLITIAKGQKTEIGCGLRQKDIVGAQQNRQANEHRWGYNPTIPN